MFVAAFAWLAQDGRISFSTGQKGALMFKRNALIVTLTRRDPQNPGGLEAQVLNAITGNQKGDFVEDIVYRVIGVSSVNPWSDVVTAARRALVPARLLHRAAKRPCSSSSSRSSTTRSATGSPRCSPRSRPSRRCCSPGRPATRRSIANCRTTSSAGIQSRYEKPETDGDTLQQ